MCHANPLILIPTPATTVAVFSVQVLRSFAWAKPDVLPLGPTPYTSGFFSQVLLMPQSGTVVKIYLTFMPMGPPLARRQAQWINLSAYQVSGMRL